MPATYLIVGEQKVLRFVVVDSSGVEVDLTGVTLGLVIVSAEDFSVEMCTKETVDFDVGLAARGVVKVTLESADLVTAGNWLGQLKIVFLDSTIDKSARFSLVVSVAIA